MKLTIKDLLNDLNAEQKDAVKTENCRKKYKC